MKEHERERQREGLSQRVFEANKRKSVLNIKRAFHWDPSTIREGGNESHSNRTNDEYCQMQSAKASSWGVGRGERIDSSCHRQMLDYLSEIHPLAAIYSKSNGNLGNCPSPLLSSNHYLSFSITRSFSFQQYFSHTSPSLSCCILVVYALSAFASACTFYARKWIPGA